MTPREMIYSAGGREVYPRVFHLPDADRAFIVRERINKEFPDVFVGFYDSVLIFTHEPELPSSYWRETEKVLEPIKSEPYVWVWKYTVMCNNCSKITHHRVDSIRYHEGNDVWSLECPHCSYLYKIFKADVPHNDYYWNDIDKKMVLKDG